MQPTGRNAGQGSSARWVASTAALALAMGIGAHAVTFQTSKKGIEFSLSVTELVGSNVAAQRVDVGVEALTVTARVTPTSLDSSAPSPVADRVERTVNDTIFIAMFANREAPCAASPNVTGTVVDRFGNRDRITSTTSPTSFVNLLFTPFEQERQCRGNGSLQRIWYSGDFVISGIDNAIDGTTYEGTLTLDVSFP